MIRFGLALAVVLLFPSVSAAQIVVSPEEAQTHLRHAADPVFSQTVKETRIGGTVKLHIFISRAGEVSAVKVTSGDPMLVPAVIAAVKTWTFNSFSVGDEPVRVETDVELTFPGGLSPEEAAIRTQLLRLTTFCSEAIAEEEYADAQRKCRQAVEVSDKLPEDVILGRSDVRMLLAQAIFLQHRVPEAISLYTEVLALDKRCDPPENARLALDYILLARAYAAAEEPSSADDMFAAAATVLEAAIQAGPDMGYYRQQLNGVLEERAQLKQNQGQDQAAQQLREKAAKLRGN